VIIYIILLITLGIALLVLEILVLPGLVAGIIGGLFLLIAVSWTFKEYGTVAGTYTATGTVILTALSLYIGLKSKVWKRFSLKHDLQESRANVVDATSIHEGDHAMTISALRPMGTILVNDIKIEARTNGEFIPANKEVVIIRIMPSGVLVKEK
jgi:membrane-bound ClpP family serine protease